MALDDDELVREPWYSRLQEVEFRSAEYKAESVLLLIFFLRLLTSVFWILLFDSSIPDGRQLVVIYSVKQPYSARLRVTGHALNGSRILPLH